MQVGCMNHSMYEENKLLLENYLKEIAKKN